MVDLHPGDAMKRGIRQDEWVYLVTPRNRIRVKANLTERMLPGVVNMAHGEKDADVNLLVDPDYTDPISGYPGFKSLLCEVEKESNPEGG
jgi:anaerobic selenocysteine-containing dehydrogenase